MNFRLSVFGIFLALLYIPAVRSYAVTSDDYYQAGLSLYQKGDYPKAIQYLKASVQMDPSNWQADQVLGYAYYQSHDNQDALTAIDQSLSTHPDNAALKSFADQIRATTAMPPPVTSATAPPPGSEAAPPAPAKASVSTENKTLFRAGKWADFHVGPVFASLGDFQKGADTVNKNTAPSVGSATNSNVGVMLGGEGGYCFDSYNSIGLSVDVGFFGGYKDQYNYGFASGTDSFTPIMGDFAVKYSRIIPLGSSRLRLGVGPGLYFTSLDVEQAQNTTTLVSGPMSGLGFGGNVNLNYEIFLTEDFMIDLYGEGRVASVSNLQGQFKDTTGNLHQVGLMMDAQNYLGTISTSLIGTNGIRWATIDYTGGDLGVGITYRY